MFAFLGKYFPLLSLFNVTSAFRLRWLSDCESPAGEDVCVESWTVILKG